ncbi:Ubiquinol-cytochrome-c reductase complex like protein [Argiope bruennichi]|uniref:Ubiquinol-cytochrome-c reductase complex like protein n=2 Tax=Argiope bruennichi TaxID=94029 RepID=A0A8T0FIK2_ARGBR|nr:Ubiquinol-cytochrome-c reductase complex like protein [Argiope bruennichi]
MINFSTSTELNGAIASVKKKLSDFMSASSKAKLGACIAYEKCADTIDYPEFFKYFDLPDTFQSWFLIVQLHVWMCTLIAITEKSGLVFRTHIVDAMWVDVETRLGHLKEVRRSYRKQFLAEITDQFRASQIAYDEGVLCDDTVLASAVWRTIFGFRNMDPRVLEAMVFYIRKQIDHLDHQNSEEILFKGAVEFLPLKSVIDKMNTL